MNIKSKLNNLFSVIHNSRFKINRRGFTLIEMLIVIAIISILSSVFLVGLRGFRGGAYDSRRLADLQKTQSYLETYYTQNRSYPATGTNNFLSSITISGVSLPNDPQPGNEYYYARCTDSQGYVLGAELTAGHSAYTEMATLSEDDTCISAWGTSGINCTKTGDAPIFCIKF